MPATAPRVITRMRPGLIAVEKREKALDHVQSRKRIPVLRGQDFDLGQGSEINDALVGPEEPDPAAAPGAQPVGGMERLVGRGEHPGGRPGRHDFRVALEPDDADFPSFRGPGPGLRLGQTRPAHQAEDGCAQKKTLRPLRPNAS